MSTFRRLVPLTVLSLLVGVPAPPASAAGVPLPKKSAYFNAPRGGMNSGGPSAITQALVKLIDDATGTAHIRIAMYFISDDVSGTSEADVLIEALRRAVQRGTRVTLIVDSFFDNAEAARIENLGSRTEVVACYHGCFGKDNTGTDFESFDKMHDKFMLIDDVT